jgi:hypothetical protein
MASDGALMRRALDAFRPSRRLGVPTGNIKRPSHGVTRPRDSFQRPNTEGDSGGTPHRADWQPGGVLIADRWAMNKRTTRPRSVTSLVTSWHPELRKSLRVSHQCTRFGTEGSEVQILSPRPKKPNKNGLRLTVMVGRRPFLLVVPQTFAAHPRQFPRIRPDFASAMVGSERP